MDKLYTTTDAANIIGISPGRVRQMVANNLLPSIRVGGNNLLTNEAIEILKQRKTKRGPEKGFKERKTA